MIRPMILATLYTIVRFFFGLAATHFRPEAELRIEVMALRHQLRIPQRQAGRPRLRAADRLLLTALGQILPQASLLITPDTVTRREKLVRRKRSYKLLIGDDVLMWGHREDDRHAWIMAPAYRPTA